MSSGRAYKTYMEYHCEIVLIGKIHKTLEFGGTNTMKAINISENVEPQWEEPRTGYPSKIQKNIKKTHQGETFKELL